MKRKKQSRPLVLATVRPYTNKNIPKYTVAGYKCTCGHSGAVQASLASPHCTMCGSKVTATALSPQQEKTVKRIETQASVSLECAKCGTHNLMSVATASTLNGKVCCASCGDSLEFDPEAVEDSEDDTWDDSDLMDPKTVLSSKSDEEEDDEEEDEEESEEEESEEDSDDDLDGDEEEDSDDDLDEDEEDEEDDEDVITASLVDPDSTDEDEDYLGGDILDSDLDDEVKDDDDCSLTTALHEMLPKSTLANVRLVPEGDTKLHLFAGTSCIATASTLGTKGKALRSKAFAKLLSTSLKEKGLIRTLENFNFTVAKVKVDDSSMVRSTVARLNKDKKKQIASAVGVKVDRFSQALEIASAGFTRDAFVEKNPLKVAIATLLKDTGMDSTSANVHTRQLFVEHGDAFTQVLVEKATQLASLGDKALNELATTYAGMEVPEPDLDEVEDVVDASDDDNELVDDYLADEPVTTTARLARPMKRGTSVTTASNGSTETNNYSGLFKGI